MEDVDLEHIEPLPTEFVTEKMSKRYSDCIRKIHWKGHTAYLLIILEFQSTKDVWIPVRILVYTALLWLDVIKYKLVTKEEGLPPVFPIVIHSGSETWDESLSIHELLSPVPEALLKYQPNNLALLVNEKTIKDEVLNKNSDFYALYLELKRAKTPMKMQEVIIKYKDILAKPEYHELLKTFIAIAETLFKQFNQDSSASDTHFASLEEAIKMIESDAINWKKNTQEYFLNKFKEEERQEGRLEGRKEGILEGKKETASAMLQKGFSLEVIGEITNLPLAEIEKLEAKKVQGSFTE